MKLVLTLIIGAGLIVGGSVLALRLIRVPKAQAQSGCTSASFQGAFGYTFNGLTGFNARPFAAVGRLVADGQGNVSGSETQSANGVISTRTYTGTYKVNPDCTGSQVSNDNFNKTVKCDFVIVSGGREIYVIETDAITSVVGTLKQQLDRMSTEPAVLQNPMMRSDTLAVHASEAASLIQRAKF
jgi:hypothetical protein